MNWQEILSLSIVAATGTLFVIKYLRKHRNTKNNCENGCGCSISESTVLNMRNLQSKL